MVKRQFQDVAVDFWVHKGSRLGTSTPCLCLHHDRSELGQPILDALIELQAEAPPARRTVTFLPCARPRPLTSPRSCNKTPGRKQHARGSEATRRVLLHALELVLVPHSDELAVLHIGRRDDVAVFEFTTLGLDLLVKAMASWLAGGEDFRVAPDQSDRPTKELGVRDRQSGELWFWGPTYDAP